MQMLGMLIATSVGEIERMIEALVEMAARAGLLIYISQCKMIFQRGMREIVEKLIKLIEVHHGT